MAIFSAISAAVGAAFTAVSTFIGGSAVGSFLLRTAVGVGLSLLAQKLAGKPDAGPDFSVSGRLQGGGDVPRTFGLGNFATAGSLVWQNTWGNAGETPNAYLTQVIALSDLPTQALNEVWVNGELVTLEASEDSLFGRPVAQYRKNGVAHMWVKFYDGTQSAADQLCVQRVSGANGRTYAATRVGVGISYAVVTSFVGNQSGLFSGWPSYKFALTGMRLYDVSRDSTRGGSGTHRLGQPETWGGDGDHLPAVQIYNLLLGLRYNASWFYGIQGMTANRLPVAHWVSQIAKCRALIAGPNGNEATYRSGGEVPVNAPLADTAEALLSTCQGRLAETGGFYKIHLGTPGAAVFSFSDGEIISTEGQSFTPFFGLAETINGITATHPSPEEGWNVKSAPPLYDVSLEAEDGNRRLLADVPLDFVPYAGQVQRLMKSALQEARRARRHTFVLPPEAWVVEPGDVIQWTSARNGYVTKLFRVDGVIDRANLDVMVDITEIDPADYNWNQSTDYRTPVDGAVGPLRPAPQVIVDWFAVGDVVRDNQGRERGPAIRLSWDGNQPGVVAVLFEVRLASTGEVVHTGRTDSVQAGSILISQNLRANVTYEVRGRYVPKSDVESLWSGWLSVTTPNVLLNNLDVFFDVDLDAIRESIDQNLQFIGADARDLRDRLRKVALWASDQVTGDELARQELRTTISATAEGLEAKFDERIVTEITRVDGVLSGVSARVETLEVSFPAIQENVSALATLTNSQGVRITQAEDNITLQGAVVSDIQLALNGYSGLNAIASAFDARDAQITAQGGQITAVANSLTLLETQVGSVAASVTVRGQAVAAPAGYSARYAIQVRGTDGGPYSEAAMFFDVAAGQPSRVVVLADQFVVASGANLAQPFVFQGGIAIMNGARIGDLRFNRLRSLNGLLDIRGDGSNASIEIYT